MKGLSQLDFTDPARQGAHLGVKYVHGEIIDYFKYQEHEYMPTAQYPQIPTVNNDGERRYLSLHHQFFWPAPLQTYVQTNIFTGREWLPRNFVFDMLGGYHQWDAGTVLTIAIVKDMGQDFNYADVREPSEVGTFPFVKWGLYSSWQSESGLYKKTNGIFQEYPLVNMLVQLGHTARRILIRRNGKILFAIFKSTGEFLGFFPVLQESEIEDGDAPDRLLIPGYSYNNRRSWPAIYQMSIEEYVEYNAATEAQVAVTTTGSVSGAPNAKTAITQGDETSYITLNVGQELEVNMTSGNFD
jgi:hypothetical protein